MSSRRLLVAMTQALVEGTAIGPDPAVDTRGIDRSVEFVEGQLAALPWMMRLATEAGLLSFRLSVWLSCGHSFESLPLRERARALRAQMNTRLAPLRYLVRALRSLSLLAFFEPPAIGRARVPRVVDPARPLPVPPPRGVVDVDEQVGVLVIGSGAGGAVTALELAAHGHDVLVVEEGHASWCGAPAGAPDALATVYRHRGMTPIRGRVPIAYVEGRCLGGSTEINSGFWHRPPAEVLLRWQAQFGLAEASPEALRPHWEWAEAQLGVGERPGGWPTATSALARGASALAWSAGEVPRTCAVTRAGGLSQGRCGVGGTLLPRAHAHGARLMTGARVVRLELSRGRVTAAIVDVTRPDGSVARRRIGAEHVFVCAGATETPALLRRSGLRRHVGDSLRIHPMLKVAATFPDRVAAGTDDIPLVQIKTFQPEIVLGGAYVSRGHLAVVLGDNWFETRGHLAEADHMACYYVGVRGTGRGWVRPDWSDPSRAAIHYELSPRDLWNLSQGLSRLSAALLEGGAEAVLPSVSGVSEIRTRVDAVRWLDESLDASACSLTTVHAFSSCPIGERRDRCAADSFGRVFGVDNLRVNDASMLPDSPGVNPQGSIMALARRNALHFCDRADA